jgi:hypothetical protein
MIGTFLQFPKILLFTNVGDPVPHVFGHPGSGSVSQRILPFSHKGVNGLKCLQNKILTQNFSKKLNF